jgi:hypothetical protein
MNRRAIQHSITEENSMINRIFALLLGVVVSCGCETSVPDSEDSAGQQTHTEQNSSSPRTIVTPSIARDSSQSAKLSDTSYVSFPALGLKLIRPEGFDDAENFYGFQQPNTQSSVMAVRVAGPYAQITAGFTAEQMKTRGMVLNSKENIEIAGKSGILVGVEQAAYGIDFSKWIVAFGNESETTIITATFPSEYKLQLSEQLKTVVLSAIDDDSTSIESSNEIGFSIIASDKLRLSQGVGKMLLYTMDGDNMKKAPDDPLFIATPSISAVEISDQRQFAVRRLFQTAHTRVGSVVETNPITIDGSNGYELLAEAEHSESGTPLRLYQVILFDGNSYFLMQGLVGTKLQADYLPEFRRMARTLTRKPM